MEKLVENALREAAREAEALDSDVVLMDAFADLVSQVTDQETAREAVNAMRQRKPVLFKETDWREMTPDRYDEAEKAFREGLRRPRRVQPNEWRDLDASRLNDKELDALSKAVGGNVNAFDRGLLTSARARQRAEDAA